MSFRVRPARSGDFDAIYEMAKLTGGGFTNLPADRGALVEKLSRSESAFSNEAESAEGDLFFFVLEDTETGRIRGTCQIFSRVGVKHHFYSYRIRTRTQTSLELGRTFKVRMLQLCTDFNGSSEVGGLFLHPQARHGGLGLLVARSRYLFIKLHRRRFADRVVSELRGVIDDNGRSHFWDSIAGRFFGMSFREADEFNAKHGTHFITNLMPRHPIYIDMLSDEARGVLGEPHPTGVAAQKMLEKEGFSGGRYVDIFDGGPTLAADTDKIRTIRESRSFTLSGTRSGDGGQPVMLAAGHLKDFAACYGRLHPDKDGSATIDEQSAALLGLAPGDRFLSMGR